jgi:peptidoglycan/LPS O-acetylase OafA/YrhL
MFDPQRIKQRAQFIRPLLLPLILYLGLLAIAVTWAPDMQPSVWRYFVALLPMIPGLFLAFGILRVSTKIDEMERRILHEAVAFSFIFTLILLLSFGLLGLVGVQQPSAIVIVAVMCMLLIVGKLWGNWRYR